MKVSKIMTRDVTLLNPDQTICVAASLMAEIDAGALPIVFADRQRAGVDFGHEARRHADGLIGVQQRHIASHYFANFHRFTSTATTCEQRARSGAARSSTLGGGPRRY